MSSVPPVLTPAERAASNGHGGPQLPPPSGASAYGAQPSSAQPMDSPVVAAPASSEVTQLTPTDSAAPVSVDPTQRIDLPGGSATPLSASGDETISGPGH